MTTDRIEEIQNKTAYPESASVQQAILQVWNELSFEYNNRTCENCEYSKRLDFDDNEQFKCVLGVSELLLNKVTKNFSCNKWERVDNE